MVLRSAWEAYGRLLDQHPLRTRSGTSFCVLGTADIVRQLSEQRGNSTQSYDPARTLRLAGFYAAVHAPWVHGWYSLLDRVVPPTPVWRSVAVKVVADQALSMPVFMAVLLASQALLQGADVDTAIARTKRDHWRVVTTTWMVWVPALCIGFGAVPAKYRLLFVNCVSVGFGTFLSKMTNQETKVEKVGAVNSGL